MGLKFGKPSRKRFNVVLLGLDAAGKTTTLFQLSRDTFVQTIPTIGITKEVIKYKNILLSTLDVGGQHAIRSVWKHYVAGVDAIIFIIDSTDTRRMNEVIVELRKVLADENARDVPFLILCNKQDLPDAMPASEIQERIESEIPELKGRQHHFQGVSAVSKQGLSQGLEWLCNALRSSSPKKAPSKRGR